MKSAPLLFSAATAIVVSLAAAVRADPGPTSSAGPTLTTLLNFNSSNGASPEATISIDPAGNLYGTTVLGGSGGNGTVFELSGAAHQTLTTLANFSGSNGSYPHAGITFDAAGNLYSSANQGGSTGYGTVFEINKSSHALSTLLTFNIGTTGAYPIGNMVFDSAGILYGVTGSGGGGVSAGGNGTAFQLSGTSHTTVALLPAFSFSTGLDPSSGLTIDPQGNLYGTTTTYGGSGDNGSAYSFTGTGHQTLTELHTFSSSYSNYVAPLTLDSNGNLFGTTAVGGANGAGMVYELSGVNHQNFSIVYSFTAAAGSPEAGVIIDAAGDIFGSTQTGGTNSNGTIFELSGPGDQTFTTLFAFNGSNGTTPYAGLTADAQGNLYGVTQYGGSSSDGTVFEITNSGYVVAVPEPIAGPLLALGGIALLRRRRISRQGIPAGTRQLQISRPCGNTLQDAAKRMPEHANNRAMERGSLFSD